MTNIKPIKTESDYLAALERVDVLMDAKVDTPEGDELDILVTLIEKYEDEHINIPPPNPVAAIKFRMEQLGMKQEDFGKIVGKNRASEILNGKRQISRDQIQKIHNIMNIPYENLFGEIRGSNFQDSITK